MADGAILMGYAVVMVTVVGSVAWLKMWNTFFFV